MDEKLYLKKLALREIKPTAIRLLILRTMMQHKEAFSLLDLENDLDTVDPIPDTPSHPCHRRRFGLSEICRLQQ